MWSVLRWSGGAAVDWWQCGGSVASFRLLLLLAVLCGVWLAGD